MSSLDALIEPSWGDSDGFTYAFASCHVVSLGFELNSLINQLTNQLRNAFAAVYQPSCRCLHDCGVPLFPRLRNVSHA
jgi:hypothetical protein